MPDRSTISRPVTIRDVAQQANVACSTVSRVLNHGRYATSVSAKAQAKVMAAIKELNYRPQQAARQLAAKKNYSIALLYINFHYSTTHCQEIYHGIVCGLHQVLQPKDVSVSLMALDPRMPDVSTPTGRVGNHEFDAFHKLPRILREQTVDGVVAAGFEPSEKDFQLLGQLNLPIVWLNSINRPDHNAIFSNNFNAGCQLMDILASYGHKRLIYCDIDINRRVAKLSRQERLKSYLESIERLNLQDMGHGIPVHENEQDRLVQILKQSNRPTAIVCHSDEVAITIYRLCRQLDWSIPRDISVVSFGGTSVAQYAVPRLTCAHENWLMMSRRAGEYILDLIQNPSNKIFHIEVPMDIYRAESVDVPCS